MEVTWVRHGGITGSARCGDFGEGGGDKDLHLVLHKVLSVDRCRALNFVFFKLGDLSYKPEAVCNTPEDEDFGAEISEENLQQL